MRAIFVLYLVNQLKFTDHRSYAIYGAFTALAYLAPLLGGIIADKLIGFRNALILGAGLMTCGHLILGYDAQDMFYIALAFIICGFGYFESNIACLVNQIYPEDHPKRDSGFVILYIGGNMGGALAPIACGYAAYYLGWEYGFSIAGIGMFIGILIFLYGSKHIPNITPTNSNYTLRLFKNLFIALASFLVIVGCVYTIQNDYETYVVGIVTVFATLAFIGLIFKNTQYRSKLLFAVLFMIFAILFWIFDDMIFTAIEVFLDRNIDSHLFGINIPASVLICVNPIAIIVLGTLISMQWQKNNPAKGYKQMIRFTFGFTLQFISFTTLAFAAYLATTTGKSSIVWAGIAIAILGVAEIFINPVALSNITKAGGAKYAGFMAALYTLYTSSIAELSSSRLAQLAATQDISKVKDLHEQARLFFDLFSQVSITLIGIIIIWLGITFIYKFRQRKVF
ncbi:hypothetical protein LO80_09220 [Candidatus Francisella endociliophora]|uniref:MFS transporter n=2 Tax=Candidatus Francisella endociliophora TaxID=653937 RepID=A0A097ERY1_9GAMM|nr:hypothetical protein LO80_09220 [Francisella sp. FSC1006]